MSVPSLVLVAVQVLAHVCARLCRLTRGRVQAVMRMLADVQLLAVGLASRRAGGPASSRPTNEPFAERGIFICLWVSMI